MICRMIIEFEVPDGVSHETIEEVLSDCVNIDTTNSFVLFGQKDEDGNAVWLDTDYEHDVLEGDSMAAQNGGHSS